MKKTTFEKLKECKQTSLFYMGQVAELGDITPEQAKIIINYLQKFLRLDTKAQILNNAQNLNTRQ